MKKIVVFTLAAVLLMAAGCSGITQEAYDALVAERDTLQSEVNTLQSEADALQSENASLNLSLESMTQALEEIIQPPEEPAEEALEEAAAAQADAFDAAAVISQLEVSEYAYTSSINTPWAIMTVQNNSDFNLDISVELTQFDEEGNMIGVSSQDQEAFESGQAIALTFMLDEQPASTEYKISVANEDWYTCVQSALSYEITQTDDKAIIAVTNTGDIAAEFVYGTALFFNGDELAGFDSTYFTDADYELKPGETINGELRCYDSFDSVQIYFAGRAG
jgi:hypothetical protein